MAEANPNRDTVNAVYRPTHAFKIVTTFPESAPTLTTQGTDCSGYNALAYTRKNVTATTSAFKVWLYNGSEWFPAVDSSILPTSVYDPTDTWFFGHLSLVGWFRYYIQAVSADGNVKFTDNLSI